MEQVRHGLRPRSVVWAVALAGLVAFTALAAAAVVIVIVAKAAPGVALSDGFYWGSTLAAVMLQVAAALFDLGVIAWWRSGPC